MCIRDSAEGAESAHLDPEQLKTLTNAKLTELAKEMGIDTAKLKTKAQLIAAITDVPLEDAIAEGVSVGDMRHNPFPQCRTTGRLYRDDPDVP